MLRYLLAIIALIFAVEITIPDAAADEKSVLQFAIEEAKGGQPEMLRDILQGMGFTPEQVEAVIQKAESDGADERAASRANSHFTLTTGPLGIIGRRSSGGSSSPCANGQCNAPAVQELQSAVGARPSLDAQRKRLTLAQRAVYNRLESSAALRDKFANEWNRRYAEKIDPNNLQQIIEIIVKYLPYVIEILMMFLKT